MENKNPTWRVGEFWSSANPNNAVLCLAEGENIILWERRGDFIRWLSPDPMEPVVAPYDEKMANLMAGALAIAFGLENNYAKDAERYRWLRDFGPEGKPAVMIEGRWYGAKLGNNVGFDLDAAIDAALSAEVSK